MKAMELNTNITFEDIESRHNHATDGFHPDYAEPHIWKAIEKSRNISRHKLSEYKRKHGWELISETADGPIFALS